MRVLYWTDFFLPHIGGVETFGGDLIPALQARGHEVTVVTSSHKADSPAFDRVGSIPVHRFPMWRALRTNDLRELVSIRRAVSVLKREVKPDITHLHFGATSYVHLQTQAAVWTPTLTTVHALTQTSLTDSSLLRGIVQASQAVNAVSVAGYELLRQAFPEAADRFSFVYYGLATSAESAIEVIAPRFDEPVILCLGRLAPQKGFDLALKAFAQVEKAAPAGPTDDRRRRRRRIVLEAIGGKPGYCREGGFHRLRAPGTGVHRHQQSDDDATALAFRGAAAGGLAGRENAAPDRLLCRRRVA